MLCRSGHGLYVFVVRAAAAEVGLKQQQKSSFGFFFLPRRFPPRLRSTPAEECIPSEAEWSRAAGDEAVCVDSAAAEF